jgi:2,4-dienoyl-CoA reductase (NADPH2)
VKPAHEIPRRARWLLQRKTERWAPAWPRPRVGYGGRCSAPRRRHARRRRYERIDDAGFDIKVDGKPQLLEVDTIVICAGQEPRRELVAGLVAAGITPQLIGGADVALELDAKRAIDQGTRVALAL